MSNTSTHPYGTGLPWLKRLLSGQPHQIIGGEHGDPYILRWYVIPRNGLFNWYVHKFLRSDDDRALHDHPWFFISLIMKGQYTEQTPAGLRLRKRGSLAYRPALARHRVILDLTKQARARYDLVHREAEAGLTVGKHTLFEPGMLRAQEEPVWTMILTGRRVRMWGFWCASPTTIEQSTDQGVNWVPHDESRPDLPPSTVTFEPIMERFVPREELGAAGCGEP